MVHVEFVGRASIGYYGKTHGYIPAAPPSLVSLRFGDEVRVRTFGELYDGATGRIERFVPTKSHPIGIRSAAAIAAQAMGEDDGIIWFAADELELIDRPAARTLTMEAVLDEAAGSGRAW
jgi:hypothetical protein